jgi:hypothetical protein
MGRKIGNGDGTSLDTSVADSHTRNLRIVWKGNKIAFDEPLPGELGVIVLFALFLTW